MSLPQVTELEFDIANLNDDPVLGKSYLFDFKKGQLLQENGKLIEIEGLPVLIQWVNMTLRTVKHRHLIYIDTEYGVRLEQLIGSNFKQSFIMSEIQREVTEALLQHPFILDIKNWTFERKATKMHIGLTVITTLGQSEVTIDV